MKDNIDIFVPSQYQKFVKSTETSKLISAIISRWSAKKDNYRAIIMLPNLPKVFKGCIYIKLSVILFTYELNVNVDFEKF